MIRHSEKNGNKKNHATLREQIRGHVAKHPRYRLDLYDACVRGSLSYSGFQQFLDEMERDGEIRINANNRVLLPEPSPETKPIPTEPPKKEIENCPEPVSMTADEILEHCRQRAQNKAGDCLKRVERDRHIGDHSGGIYQISHSGNKKVHTSDFERAGFSLMPTKSDGYPAVKYRQHWNTRRKARDWGHSAWRNAYGIKIFTGKASRKIIDSTVYYPICWDIEEGLLLEHPNVFRQIVEWAIAIPGASLMISKSGGLRINAWCPFIREKRLQMVARREWKDPDNPDKINGITYVEIISGKGLARIDERYLLAKGRIDEFPVLIESEFMEPLEWVEPLDDRIHKRASDDRIHKRTQTNKTIPTFDESLPHGLTWKQGDKFLISTQRYDCEQNHASNPTCEYRKHDNGTITRWCWACNTGWKIVTGKNRTYTAPIVSNDRSGKPEPVRTLPPDDPILISGPQIEVRETASFCHFSKEERQVVSDVLSLDPDAGWHGPTPVFTPKYEYLYPLTQKFACNGQPSEVEKRRVWSTLFGKCEVCGADTAKWVDRYLLKAGLYCDGCHRDYPLGSYLELELNRKLPNSIVSDYQGFLGDDPEFADFRLWQPGVLTHLGAAMLTGKTTEIDKQMTDLAIQGLGKGIIATPNVSLARYLAEDLRWRDGHRAWGLWNEGCQRSDKFIGEYGAIVCLPSLPQAVKWASDAGVDRLYIAIDEVDFGYNLLSLSIEQATAIKKILRHILKTIGLVVSGQTESTLALEAFAEELGCEQVQGFYNTAKPADGHVVMNKYPNIKGKSNAMLCGMIDNISDLLSAGYNPYVFCSSRRDGDVIADVFQHENPVVYNAYTKGDPRADALLINKGLTDSRLFIGTSAAGVGISIHDPKARTVIGLGLNHGSQNTSMAVQEGVRDRGRCGIWFHHADYNLPLPVRPTENEKVSIYHEAVKAAASRNAHLPAASIRKIAYAQALASLADTQPEVFIKYHLQTVGNMAVHHASALVCEPERIAVIASRRNDIRRAEREERITTAIEVLKQRDLLRSWEIRVLSNKGSLSKEMRLAHETANAVAKAVGWDDKTDAAKDVLNNDALDVALRLTEENINIEKLTKQRRGYLAASFPDWTAHQFESDLEKSDAQSVTNGLGIEITAIHDDRLLGEMLTALLERLIGRSFDSASLAESVRDVLKTTCSSGDTFINEITLGALGASAYRNARFLCIADDERVLGWVRAFISQWYPARVAKDKDTYTLRHAKNLDLRLAAFSRWLRHQPSVLDGTQIDLDIFQPVDLPDPYADLKNVVRLRRGAGEKIKEIAESLDHDPRTISKWCEGIKPPSPVACDVLGILRNGAVWKTSDIEAHSRYARQNVSTALKKLVDAGKIDRIQRGLYQIKK